jgi:hypothetical protein
MLSPCHQPTYRWTARAQDRWNCCVSLAVIANIREHSPAIRATLANLRGSQ